MRQLQEGLADETAGAHQGGVHAELFDTTRQRSGLAIDAAEENQIGIFTADGGQYGAEVHCFVVNILAIDDFDPLRVQRLNKLVRQPLTKSGTVIDHRDAFGLQGLYRVLPGKLAAVIVVAHHAEAGVETLSGIGVSGSDRRDLGDAGIVVNPCGGNAGAGVPVADDAGDAAIHQTLSDGNGGTRVGLIVFRLQFKGYRLAADGRVLLVDIVNRQLRAVFEILADTRGRAGQRARQADNHGFAGRRPCGG